MRKLIFPLIFILSVMPVQAQAPYRSKGVLKINADRIVSYQAGDFETIYECIEEKEEYLPVIEQAYVGYSNTEDTTFSAYKKLPLTNINIEVRQADGTPLARLDKKDFDNVFDYVESTMKKDVRDLVLSAERDRNQAKRIVGLFNGHSPAKDRRFEDLEVDLILAGIVGSIGECNNSEAGNRKYYQIESLGAMTNVYEGEEWVGWKYPVSSKAITLPRDNKGVDWDPTRATYNMTLVDHNAEIESALDYNSFGNIIFDANGSNVIYNMSGVLKDGKLIYGTSSLTNDKSKWVSGSEIYFRTEDLNEIKARLKEDYKIIDEAQKRKKDCYDVFIKILESKGIRINGRVTSFSDLYEAADTALFNFHAKVPSSNQYYTIEYEFQDVGGFEVLTALTIKPVK